MRIFRICAALLALALSGCLRHQEPLNPPQLVTARDSDLAIQLFMQATILLGKYYDFDTLDYEALRDRSVRHGYSTLPFMPPIAHRATPPFVRDKLPSEINFHLEHLKGPQFRTWANGFGGHRALLTYYVSTGWRAAQMICRNYLVGLEEKNEYLEFLQKEFNIGATLANASLIAAGANVTLRAIGVATQWAGNQTIDAYQDFRFLPLVDRDTARALVESAQNEIAFAYLPEMRSAQFPNARGGDAFFPAGAGLSGFSEAVQAISLIEQQCTRSGIRGLVTKAGVAAAAKKGAKMYFDLTTNQIEFLEKPPAANPPAPKKKTVKCPDHPAATKCQQPNTAQCQQAPSTGSCSPSSSPSPGHANPLPKDK